MTDTKENITNEQLGKAIESVAVNLAQFQQETKVTNEQLSEKIKSLAVNNEQLAKLLESVAVNLAKFQLEITQEVKSLKQETEGSFHELRGSIQGLYKGMFTEEEKEKLLAMADHYDKWLEEDTLGKRRITLTRKEYDFASSAEPFPNRFQPA